MENSSIANNRAVGGDNPSGPGYYAFGGGIDAIDSKGRVTKCRIANNEAVGGQGKA